MDEKRKLNIPYAPSALRYSAGARCRCGRGLAYPKGEDAHIESAWICAGVLRGEIENVPAEHGQHDAFLFCMYEIKSEAQPSARGATTRPSSDGVVWWEPRCLCRKCGCEWTESRRLPSSPDPWKVNPCPKCGAVDRAPNGSSSMDIEVRACDVLIPPAPEAAG